MNNINNYMYFVNEAIKLENSKSVFEYLVNDMTLQRYEKIAELYEKAGNILQISNKELSIEYYIKSYNYMIKIGSDDYKLNQILLKLANLYLKINYNKSIEYMTKILNLYIIRGDIVNIIKTQKSIGDIYFDNNCLEDAYITYLKVIELIDSSDKCFDIKKNTIEKMSELYYENEYIINVFELSKLYFSVSDDYLKKNLGYLSAKTFILNGLLMNLATEDIVQTNINLEIYSNRDHTFQSSIEGKFILNIIKAVETSNFEEISFLCSNYDKSKPLNKIQLKLLIKIKENVEGGNKSNENYDSIEKAEAEAEVDFC